MKDLQELVQDEIRETLMDTEGAGSDLEYCYPLDPTWVRVVGQLDIEHLASHVLHVLGVKYEYASRYTPDPDRPEIYFQSAWGPYRRAVQNIEDTGDSNTTLVRRVSAGEEEVVTID